MMKLIICLVTAFALFAACGKETEVEHVDIAVEHDDTTVENNDMTIEHNDITVEYDDFIERLALNGRATYQILWNLYTGGIPADEMEEQANALAELAAGRMELILSDEMGSFLQSIETGTAQDEALYRALHRIFTSEREALAPIPVDEYAAFAELRTSSINAWEEAIEKSDFTIFAPYLSELLDYQRRFITYRQDAGQVFEHPYDAFLEIYEPGMTVRVLDVFFAELRAEIVPLLQSILQSDKVIRDDFLYREVPIEIQRNTAEFLMELFGYDLNRGQLAESSHPFSMTLAPNDVRITTSYIEDDFFDSFFSVIHEIGHALYEQNVSENIMRFAGVTSLASSMGIHESQSRFYENMIARSLEFWLYIYDDFQTVTEGYFSDVSAVELYEAVNIVRPSLFRVTADELTYSLHVMVRYEIEKMMFSEEGINVDDLPQIWNEKMQEYLGITPDNDANGVLQDIHWADGYFGYFPSYTLGNAYAAQMFNAMRTDLDFEASLLSGNIAEISDWLTERVHRHGFLLTPPEILAQITDEGFTARYFVEYLKTKYTDLYGL
jgi:carboxypeptidase Taq